MADTRLSYSAPITGCARCGDDHPTMPFYELERPAGEYTHWTTCPRTDEPVLSKIVQCDTDAPTPKQREDREEVVAAMAVAECIIDSIDEGKGDRVTRDEMETLLRGLNSLRTHSPEEPVELFLCEANAVVLKADTLYRFVEDPECAKCKEEADVYREPIGQALDGEGES